MTDVARGSNAVASLGHRADQEKRGLNAVIETFARLRISRQASLWRCVVGAGLHLKTKS